ncbi:hypothetical protein J6590_021680 [Homalodisca vitripennis]|nr:hypothetical protein J6590_021680 [Homalodisca vitripennis]
MEELLWAPPLHMTNDELDDYIYKADKIVYHNQKEDGTSKSQTRVSDLCSDSRIDSSHSFKSQRTAPSKLSKEL